MSEFFAMGHYGIYVWPAYATFLIVLLIDALMPVLQRRRTLRELRNRVKRQNARGTPSGSSLP